MQKAVREQMREQARQIVQRGRDARSVMGLPVVQEFFTDELALATERFIDTDNANELVSLHFRTRALVDLMEHLEKAVVAGDAADGNLRKQGE